MKVIHQIEMFIFYYLFGVLRGLASLNELFNAKIK